MASSFSQYQNGIQPVQGIIQAGAQIGQFSQSGLQNFGNALANGIATYNENQGKADLVNAKAGQMAQQLQGYYGMLSKDPEYAKYADQILLPQIEKLKKIPELALPKKLGLLAGAEVAFNDFGNSIKMYDTMRANQLRRDIGQGETEMGNNRLVGQKPAIAKTKWNPNISGIENYNAFREQLSNARKAGFTGDDNDAIYNWLEDVKNNAADGAFEGLSPEQSYQIRGGVLDQIYALQEKLTAELSGATPYAGDVERSGMTTKDFLSTKTVVTDASGKPVSINLPSPSKGIDVLRFEDGKITGRINRGSVARYVNTERGLIRVEVNQEYPSDMLPDSIPTAVAPSAPAPVVVPPPPSASVPAPAPVPAALPPPPSAPAPVVTAPVPAPVPAPAPVPVIPLPPPAPAPAPAPAPVVRTPEALPPPPSKAAEAKPTSKPAGKTDISVQAYARSLGISEAEFTKAVKEYGVSAPEFYKQLQKDAESNGMSPEQWFKTINTPSTADALPPPESSASAPAAPEGLPAPEPKYVDPRSAEGQRARIQRRIEQGAYAGDDGNLRYDLEKGDTAAKVAKRFGLSLKKVEDLMKESGIDRNKSNVGDSIILGSSTIEGEMTEEEAAGVLGDAGTTGTAGPAGATAGLELKRSSASSPEEAALVREAWGADLRKHEKEIEASKRARSGLKGYLDSIIKGGKPYYGAETNMTGGWTNDEDFLVPEFDKQFPDSFFWDFTPATDRVEKGKRGTRPVEKDQFKGGLHFDNNLKETEAYIDSWKTILQIQKDTGTHSMWTGGRAGKLAFGEPWGVTEKIKAKEALEARIKQLDASIPTLEKNYASLKKTPPSYGDVKAKVMGETVPAGAGMADILPSMSEVQTTIGTREVTKDLTTEEKKTRLKSFLMERYKDSEGRSYIPSGFDAMYTALHPESAFKVIDTEIGPMFWDGNSFKQAQVSGKQMTTADVRESKRGIFGQQTEKGWIPEEVGQETGVFLAGLFNRSDADLTKFDEMAINNASGLAAIRGIKEVLKIPLHTIPIGKKRQEAYGRVQVYIAALKAAMRTDIVGVGTVSNFEQAMIAKAVPDPSEFWRLDDADWGRVYEIEKRLKNQLINTGAMKGVTVMFKEPEAEKNVEAALRTGNKNLK